MTSTNNTNTNTTAIPWTLAGGPMAERNGAEPDQTTCGACAGRGHLPGGDVECAPCDGRGWRWTDEHAANGYGDSISSYPLRFPTPQTIALHREAALAGDAAALGRLRVMPARRPELLPYAGEAAALLSDPLAKPDPLAKIRARWAANRPEFEARMAEEAAAIEAENAADRALFVGQPNGDDVADA